MKRKTKLMILSLIIITIAAGCTKQVFSGSRTSNDVQFIMDYTVLNKIETHKMKLEAGDSVNVAIVNTAGRVDVVVEDSTGKEIYKGNNADSTEFTLEIVKPDTYKFSVTGNKAKGGVSFKVEK